MRKKKTFVFSLLGWGGQKIFHQVNVLCIYSHAHGDIPRREAEGPSGDDIDLTSSTRKHIYTKHVVVSQREPERA